MHAVAVMLILIPLTCDDLACPFCTPLACTGCTLTPWSHCLTWHPCQQRSLHPWAPGGAGMQPTQPQPSVYTPNSMQSTRSASMRRCMAARMRGWIGQRGMCRTHLNARSNFDAGQEAADAPCVLHLQLLGSAFAFIMGSSRYSECIALHLVLHESTLFVSPIQLPF